MEGYSDEQRASDFEWYKDNLLDLYFRYGEGSVAIKNRTVLGFYPTRTEAIAQTERTHELGAFIVQELGPDESAYVRELPYGVGA